MYFTFNFYVKRRLLRLPLNEIQSFSVKTLARREAVILDMKRDEIFGSFLFRTSKRDDLV